MEAANATPVPEWDIAWWFNTSTPLAVADLRGQVVLVHAWFAGQGVGKWLCGRLLKARS